MSEASPGTAPERPLLEGRGLRKTFRRRRGLLGSRPSMPGVVAVDGIDVQLFAGETLALVGESGCGKTTLARLLLRLLDPSAGRVWFDGRDVTSLGRSQLRTFRRQCQMIFQDPAGSLDPRMRAGAAIAEPLRIHRMAEGGELQRRCSELLDRVGLPRAVCARVPSELSGGQRQRVAIARALATEPRALVADEPVTALDVSVRAQIVNLLSRLQRELELGLLFIGHDLALVAQLADRVGVMFAGRLVELAPIRELYARPLHPYSAELLAAIPRFGHPRRARRRAASGPRSSTAHTTGCPFRLRCPLAIARCETERPLLSAAEPARLVACHRPGELGAVDGSRGRSAG